MTCVTSASSSGTWDCPEMSDHGPVEQDKEASLRALGRAIAELFPHLGFVVLMFDWGDHSRVNYISNARRDAMLVALKELVARMEGHYHDDTDRAQ
jgi:hypothetical protein